MSEFSESGPKPKMVMSPDNSGGGSPDVDNKKENFRPSFLFESEADIDESGIDKSSKYGKAVLLLHSAGDNLSQEALQNSAFRLYEMAVEEDVDLETNAYVQGKLGERILSLQETAEKPAPNQELPPYATSAEKADLTNVRPFTEIRSDIEKVLANPDPAREDALKQELKILGNAAERAGILSSIRNDMDELIGSTPDLGLERVRERLLKIASQADTYESDANKLPGWDDKYEGLIQTFAETYMRRFYLVLMDESARMAPLTQQEQANYNNRANEDSLYSWEKRPLKFDEAVIVAFDKVHKANEDKGSYKDIVQGFKDVFESANVPPAEQRKSFEEIEELGLGVVEVPRLTSVFLKDLEDKEEKLYWQARMALSNARSLRQAATSPENLFPNDHIQKMTNKEFEVLYNHPGVLEAHELYTIMVLEEDLSTIDTDFGKLFQNFIVTRLVDKKDQDKTKQKQNGGRKEKEEKLEHIKNLYDIRSDSELAEFRQRFRKYLENRFELTEDQAREADLISFNLFLMSDVSEYANSFVYFEREKNKQKEEEANQEKGKKGRKKEKNQEVDKVQKRLKAAEAYSVIINGAQRDLVHPLEKSLDDNRDRPGKRRAWPPNILGEYIKYHPKYDRKKIEKYIPANISEEHLNYLQDFEIHGSEYEDLFEKFKNEGLKLAKGTRDRAEQINWNSVSGENPYLAYYLSKNKQVLVWNTLNSGGLPRDKTVEQLGNALTDLEIPDEFRETLAILIASRERPSFTLDATKKKFEPRWGLLIQRISRSGFWDNWRRNHPGYFTKKHSKKTLLDQIMNLGG